LSDSRKNQARFGQAARPVADYVSHLLSPVIEQRAGMRMDLIASWEEIAGQEYSQYCRPEKLNWPRQIDDEDPFKPAALVIACEASHVLFLQHDTAGLIKRVNTYFGFAAVDRIKLVQKPVVAPVAKRRKTAKPLKKSKANELSTMLEGVEDEALRASLEKLGRDVFSSGSS